jgi:hypothetical protein
MECRHACHSMLILYASNRHLGNMGGMVGWVKKVSGAFGLYEKPLRYIPVKGT